MGNNNIVSNSSKLGGIFLIIGWIVAIGLISYLIHLTIFGTKDAMVTNLEHGVRITLTRDYDSHFRIKGNINGVAVTFLVDTGATSVAVSDEIAESAGLSKGSKVQSATANGTTTGYLTRIKELDFGDVALQNVGAVIIPNLGSEVLLGMNVLSRFTVQQTKSQMIITVP